MELLAQHTVLAEGDSSEACKAQVLHFLQQTTLVRYDNIVIAEPVLSGKDPAFAGELDSGLKKNRETLARFVKELESTGFEKRTDLMNLSQGYHSKILHIIAHFLDGFIGIDSVFYNLVDDSHWLPDETRNQITLNPDRFRLMFLKCYSLTPKEASLLHR